MSTAKYQIWRERGAALFAVIDHHLAALAASQEAVSRKETLLALLTALKAFGDSQLEFFVRGFDPAYDAIRLEPSTVYPPEYAMRATVDQIAYDLDVIQRAYQQRLPTQSTPEMCATLAKADYLAYRALRPAITHGLIEDVSVVTYFQKAVNVRIIPYAPVAFIGLPLSALATPRDLLAIPHEVGHYVYRHGRTQQGLIAGSRFDAALTQQLTDLPAWCRAWLEEIFADVYGALVGGPVMALGFADLVTDDPFADFTADDGEHPIAALRPAIYQSVLARQGNYRLAVEELGAYWAQQLQARGKPTEFKPHDQERLETLETATAAIERAMSVMLTDLGGLPVDTALWSAPLPDGAAIEGLFGAFARQIKELAVADDNLAPELTVASIPGARGERMSTSAAMAQTLYLRPLRDFSASGPRPSFDLGGSNPVTARRVGETGLWIDALKRGDAPFNLPPAVWMALLDGSGWAIEGPGSNAH